MSRSEYMEWCKKTAIQQMCATGEGTSGLLSMMSNLQRHPETNDVSLISACTLQLMMTPTMTMEQGMKFINGFN